MRVATILLMTAVLLFVAMLYGCGGAAKPAGGGDPGEVVLFCSLDPIFSEPIVRDFEKATGIRVKFQTDSEAAKTVGLANRLIARKDHPECDVFWNNEVGQTLVLKEKGVLEKYVSPAAQDIPGGAKDPDGWWTGFAARARVILYNTEMLAEADAPKTLADLADPRLKGQVVIARPLFGTSFSHAATLFESMGPAEAKAWFNALKQNDVRIAPGNAQARNMVADGEAAVCLTDTDDANGALMKARPVKMIYPDQSGEGRGTLLIPNSVCLIKGGPNAAHAKTLIDYLLSREVEARLCKSESAQMPLREGVEPHSEAFNPTTFKSMDVNWASAAKHFDAVAEFVQKELNW